MEWNRNQFFMAGVILLVLGLQLRYVESYELTEKCTKFINSRLEKSKKKARSAPRLPFATIGKSPLTVRRKVKPPTWLGYAFLSVGAVLVLQSFAMPKPES